MANTINNGIPFVEENTSDPAAGLNLALNVIDALTQLSVLSVGDNTPPGSPAEGARYIVGTSPTGAWAGQAGKLARYLDAHWSFYNANIAVNSVAGTLHIKAASGWITV